MPLAWIAVLSSPDVDFVSAFQKLKYELTIEDVYDLLEIIEFKKWENFEKQQAQEEANKRR